jgi:RimJ/RimL family protein N-acetyltransferase
LIVFDKHEDVCRWASRLLFNCDDSFDEKARAMAVIKNDKIIAAVIYTDYQPNLSIEMSVASIDKSWATRHNLRAFFKYPFIDLGVKRVTTLCSANRRDLIMFNKRLGFTPEGYHREADYNGGDSVSFGMLKSECKWVK